MGIHYGRKVNLTSTKTFYIDCGQLQFVKHPFKVKDTLIIPLKDAVSNVKPSHYFQCFKKSKATTISIIKLYHIFPAVG